VRSAESATRTCSFAGISKNTVLLAFTSLFADISSEMLYPGNPFHFLCKARRNVTLNHLCHDIVQSSRSATAHSERMHAPRQNSGEPRSRIDTD
jgi:hypothetical protein